MNFGPYDDLLSDSHNVLNRWKNYFSLLLNVHNGSDVRQIEVFVLFVLNYLYLVQVILRLRLLLQSLKV
jgi:hypothetical protein